MAVGHSTRAISSPIGTAGAAAPYGMPSAGAANRRVQGRKFVPLSLFFLQMGGEDLEADEEQRVQGYTTKKTTAAKKLGQVDFDDDENAQTRANKGPRPRPKKKPKPKEQEVEEDTGTANVASYPVPIGAPLRRTPRLLSKERKRWMDRLVKSMT